MIIHNRIKGFFAGTAILLSGCDKAVNNTLLPADTVKAFAKRLQPIDTFLAKNKKLSELSKFSDTSDIKLALSMNHDAKIKETDEKHYILVNGDFAEYDSTGASLKSTHYSAFDKSSTTVPLKNNIEDHSIEYNYNPSNFYYDVNSNKYCTGGAITQTLKDGQRISYPETGKI